MDREWQMPQFAGPLKDVCAGFITEKRAAGYKYEGQTELVRRFDNFTVALNFPPNSLPKEVVDTWCERKIHESSKTHSLRVNVLVLIAEYMLARGFTAYMPMRVSYPGAASMRYSAYIFSDDEIARFFRVVDHFPESKASPFRHLILPLLFRLLFCCGLRLSEGICLKVEDVDMDNGILSIRNTKFGKDRLIPITPELNQLCISYAERALRLTRPKSYFFPSPQGGHYCKKTIGHLYRAILWEAGISHGGRGKGPRIHDFRHTFAVRCLRQWVLAGRDITAALPTLSAYLGHADLRGSELYLRLTADLYPDTVARLEDHFGDVIPTMEEAME